MNRIVIGVASLAGAFALPLMSACMQVQNSTGLSSATGSAITAEKPFVSGGTVNIQLDAGDYDVRPASGNVVRVSLTGNTGNATADVAITDNSAAVSVKNTAHTNFHGVIEVPKVANLVVHLSAGDLNVGAVTGSKDVESAAGDVRIDVGNADDYASVDAAVRVGDMSTGPFNGSTSGLIGHELKWTGKGKYALRARLGAGDLNLK
jgi:hypothetical protein